MKRLNSAIVPKLFCILGAPILFSPSVTGDKCQFHIKYNVFFSGQIPFIKNNHLRIFQINFAEMKQCMFQMAKTFYFSLVNMVLKDKSRQIKVTFSILIVRKSIKLILLNYVSYYN